MEKVTVNKSQRLYVLKDGDYYSCLGFNVVFNKAKAMAAWLKISDFKPATKGSVKLYKQYLELSDIVRNKCVNDNLKCDINLSTQLKGLEGKRVEVITTYGEKRRFIVGKSTGWIPCHLEIKTTRSSGGCAAEKVYKSVKLV